MHSYRPRRTNHHAGWLLFTVAVLAIAAGMGTGHGLVLVAGLVLAPFGLHLISGDPAPTRRVRTVRPAAAIGTGLGRGRVRLSRARRRPVRFRSHRGRSRRPSRPGAGRPRARAGARVRGLGRAGPTTASSSPDVFA
jgi:hypothetical protein